MCTYIIKCYQNLFYTDLHLHTTELFVDINSQDHSRCDPDLILNIKGKMKSLVYHRMMSEWLSTSCGLVEVVWCSRTKTQNIKVNRQRVQKTRWSDPGRVRTLILKRCCGVTCTELLTPDSLRMCELKELCRKTGPECGAACLMLLVSTIDRAVIKCKGSTNIVNV